MPSLHRTLHRLKQHADACLCDLVRASGGEYALDGFETTIDPSGPGYMVLRVEFRGRVIWAKRVGVMGLYNDGVALVDDDDTMKDIVTSTMKAHLDLVAQMHHARLERLFPRAIEGVAMEFSEARNCKMIKVKFKNGHVAEGPEHEAKSELFLARCVMLYDLPRL